VAPLSGTLTLAQYSPELEIPEGYGPEIVVTATRRGSKEAEGARKTGFFGSIHRDLGFLDRFFGGLFSGNANSKRTRANDITITFRQPGVTRGLGHDVMGQPLKGRSNYDAGTQFRNIISDAANVSFGTTAKRLGQWGTYTVPDAAQRRAEIFDPYRGMTPEGRALAARTDRLTGGTISGIATGVSIQLGADQRTQDLVYGLGSSADGLLLSGAALRGGSIGPYTGRNSLSVVNGENGTHGNSRLSARTTWLYELQTKGGQFLKYGISVNPNTRYTSSFMRDKVIEPITSGTRADMLKLEREMVTANPGQLNLEPWAVKARQGN
jgi:hypothetical protein